MIIAGIGAAAVAYCPRCREWLQEMLKSKMSHKCPEMMEKHLAKMEPAERREMLAECRAMLDGMEAKFPEE